jgi:hypothetical protein
MSIMTLLLALVIVAQSLSLSLGVGAATLALLHFFSAIKDGVVDDTERRMIGLSHQVLKVVLTLLLGTSVYLVAGEYNARGLLGLSEETYFFLTLLFILFGLQLLMNARLVSTTLGPALQVGTWWALATFAVLPLEYVASTYWVLLFSYLTWLILAVGVVNALLYWMTVQSKSQETSPGRRV